MLWADLMNVTLQPFNQECYTGLAYATLQTLCTGRAEQTLHYPKKDKYSFKSIQKVTGTAIQRNRCVYQCVWKKHSWLWKNGDKNSGRGARQIQRSSVKHIHIVSLSAYECVISDTCWFFFCYFSRHERKHSFSSTNKLYKHDPVSTWSKRYSWELAFWLGSHLLFSCLSVLGILGACSQLVLRKDASRQCVSNNPVSSMTKIYACAGCPLRSGQWRTDKL